MGNNKDNTMSNEAISNALGLNKKIDEGVKYKGLWTPEYLVKDLLFPTPKSIDYAEMRLKSWAKDIIEVNNNKDYEKLKKDYEFWQRKFIASIDEGNKKKH